MKENHKNLLDSVMKSIDWTSLLKVQKSFNLGIGTGNFTIPGLRWKDPALGITIRDLKNELRSIIKYMINNDVPQLQYSYWHIFWTNDEWEFSMGMGQLPKDGEFDDEEFEDEEFFDDEEEIDLQVKARIEVLYCPQRIMLMDTNIVEKSDKPVDMKKLERALSNAILNEEYEKAVELRDFIRSINKK